MLLLLLWIAFWLSLKKNIVLERGVSKLTDEKGEVEAETVHPRLKKLFWASGMLVVLPSLCQEFPDSDYQTQKPAAGSP